MKTLKILLFTITLLFITGCANTAVGLNQLVIVNDTLTDLNITLELGASFNNVSLNVNVTNPPEDFFFSVTSDKIDGKFAQTFTAHNPDIDNSGSKEDLWEGDGLMTYLTTAQKYNISSTDADDTDGGTGGRLLFVVGLNSTYDFVVEFLTLNGTNTIQTVNEYIRPRVISAITAGSSGFNEGVITATSANTGDIQLVMDATEGTSKNTHFTVPRGQTAYLVKSVFTTSKTSGASPIVEFKGLIRLGSFANASWIETFDLKIDTSVNDGRILEEPLPNGLGEKTDFRVEVTTTQDNTDANARLSFLFEDN